MKAYNQIRQSSRGFSVLFHENWADSISDSRESLLIAQRFSAALKYRELATSLGSRTNATMDRKTVMDPSIMKRYCQFYTQLTGLERLWMFASGSKCSHEVFCAIEKHCHTNDQKKHAVRHREDRPESNKPRERIRYESHHVEYRYSLCNFTPRIEEREIENSRWEESSFNHTQAHSCGQDATKIMNSRGSKSDDSPAKHQGRNDNSGAESFSKYCSRDVESAIWDVEKNQNQGVLIRSQAYV